MEINKIIQEISPPVKRENTEIAVSSRQNADTKAADKKSTLPDANVNIVSKQAADEKHTEKDKKIKPAAQGLSKYKAVFAVDEEKNVVIRFLDKDGKTVMQFPPEEYLVMAKRLNEMVDSIYSKKV